LIDLQETIKAILVREPGYCCCFI